MKNRKLKKKERKNIIDGQTDKVSYGHKKESEIRKDIF